MQVLERLLGAWASGLLKVGRRIIKVIISILVLVHTWIKGMDE